MSIRKHPDAKFGLPEQRWTGNYTLVKENYYLKRRLFINLRVVGHLIWVFGGMEL